MLLFHGRSILVTPRISLSLSSALALTPECCVTSIGADDVFCDTFLPHKGQSSKTATDPQEEDLRKGSPAGQTFAHTHRIVLPSFVSSNLGRLRGTRPKSGSKEGNEVTCVPGRTPLLVLLRLLLLLEPPAVRRRTIKGGTHVLDISAEGTHRDRDTDRPSYSSLSFPSSSSLRKDSEGPAP
ncbi:hypothetical protein Q5P01_012835 [Channa striata]|uniref:Secreted protein n=1 Tax=Channa striata TaxID=64152 RepID=A0AA88STG1_CHASR|nr:hypothetical protein Q5P01_012835 [Channa striata]